MEKIDNLVCTMGKPAPIAVFANLWEEVHVESMWSKEKLNINTIYANVRRTDKSMAFLNQVYKYTKSRKAKYYFNLGNDLLWYYTIDIVEFEEQSIKLELNKTSVPIEQKIVQSDVDHDADKKELDDFVPKVGMDADKKETPTRRINSVKLNKVTRL